MSFSQEPHVQFGSRIVFLEVGSIENNGSHEGDLTRSERILFLRLLEKALTSSHGCLAVWYLAQYLSNGEASNHAIETHISKIRQKIGETRYEPTYLVKCSGIGYKLCIPEGCCFVTLQQVREILAMLNRS